MIARSGAKRLRLYINVRTFVKREDDFAGRERVIDDQLYELPVAEFFDDEICGASIDGSLAYARVQREGWRKL